MVRLLTATEAAAILHVSEAKLAILAIGFALGAASVLWLIGRSMVTPERVPAWVHDEDALPPFDPHLWRERMR